MLQRNVKSHGTPLPLADPGENMPRRALAVKAYPCRDLCNDRAEMMRDTRPPGASSSAAMPAMPHDVDPIEAHARDHQA
jgi:hypothetical protein